MRSTSTQKIESPWYWLCIAKLYLMRMYARIVYMWRFSAGYGIIRHHAGENPCAQCNARRTALRVPLPSRYCRRGEIWLPLPAASRHRRDRNEGKDIDRQFHLVVSFRRWHKNRHHHYGKCPHRRARNTECVPHDDAGSLHHTAASARDGGRRMHALRHRDDFRRSETAPTFRYPVLCWGLHESVPGAPPLARGELRYGQKSKRP